MYPRFSSRYVRAAQIQSNRIKAGTQNPLLKYFPNTVVRCLTCGGRGRNPLAIFILMSLRPTKSEHLIGNPASLPVSQNVPRTEPSQEYKQSVSFAKKAHTHIYTVSFAKKHLPNSTSPILPPQFYLPNSCLLYTSDAADE